VLPLSKCFVLLFSLPLSQSLVMWERWEKNEQRERERRRAASTVSTSGILWLFVNTVFHALQTF